jgi:hypothetical protein
MDFDVIVDTTFLELGLTQEYDSPKNKHLVSIINDFEDGSWNFEKFQNFIWDNIAETALSQNERSALYQKPSTILKAAAKNLRLSDSDKDIGKGSELAEIILYGLMKHKYKALPIVPKIFYKQNSQDNAKGADSVHIIIQNEQFTLWFGEAKFYNSLEDTRLASIINSVKNSLETSKLKKENSIITNISDIDLLDIKHDLRIKIKKALSNSNSIDTIKNLIHIPILLIHQCDITNQNNQFSDEYINKIKEIHLDRAKSYFEKQDSLIKKEIFKYTEINFHLILFPVPNKEKIVNSFVKSVNFCKGY